MVQRLIHNVLPHSDFRAVKGNRKGEWVVGKMVGRKPDEAGVTKYKEVFWGGSSSQMLLIG